SRQDAAEETRPRRRPLRLREALRRRRPEAEQGLPGRPVPQAEAPEQPEPQERRKAQLAGGEPVVRAVDAAAARRAPTAAATPATTRRSSSTRFAATRFGRRTRTSSGRATAASAGRACRTWAASTWTSTRCGWTRRIRTTSWSATTAAP